MAWQMTVASTIETQIMENTKFFDDGECPICYLPQVNKSYPPCNHVFCHQCLMNWSNFRSICPVCTKDFSEVTHNDGKTISQVRRAPPVEKLADVGPEKSKFFFLIFQPIYVFIVIAYLFMIPYFFTVNSTFKAHIWLFSVTAIVCCTLEFYEVWTNRIRPNINPVSVVLFANYFGIVVSLVVFVVSETFFLIQNEDTVMIYS